MLQIILIIVGVVALAKQEIKVSKNKKIVGKTARIIGGLFLAAGIGMSLVPNYKWQIGIFGFVIVLCLACVFFIEGATEKIISEEELEKFD